MNPDPASPTPNSPGGRAPLNPYLVMLIAIVAPGSGQYSLGSPAIDDAILHLENGKTLEIQAINQSDKNVYVKKIVLNDKPLDRLYITHEEIMNGGKLVFYMSDKHK